MVEPGQIGVGAATAELRGQVEPRHLGAQQFGPATDLAAVADIRQRHHLRVVHEEDAATGRLDDLLDLMLAKVSIQA